MTEETTTYHSYVIENEAGVRAVLFSSSSDDPTLPAGWKMIGRQSDFNIYANQMPLPAQTERGFVNDQHR